MDFFIRYPDDILSTKIIGERQFNKAVDLFMSATKELTGKVDYRHVYQNFSEIEVELSGKTKVRTCPAALGPGFAAGTTDGPGMFGFQQGDTEVRTLFSFLKNVYWLFKASLNGFFGIHYWKEFRSLNDFGKSIM